jgi:hypothetical protein
MSVVQRLFCCSVCEKSFTIQYHCTQHCSQPRSLCNRDRGKAPEKFSTPIELFKLVRVGQDNRVVGGIASRGNSDSAAAASGSESAASLPVRPPGAQLNSDSESGSDNECDLDSAGGSAVLGLGTGDSDPESGDVAVLCISHCYLCQFTVRYRRISMLDIVG